MADILNSLLTGQDIVKLRDARRRGVITSEEFAKITALTDPAAIDANMSAVEDRLRQSSALGRAGAWIGGLSDGFGTFVGNIGFGRIPIWMWLVVAGFLLLNGWNGAAGLFDLPKLMELELPPAYTDNWVRIGGEVPIPISKLPLPIDGWKFPAAGIIAATLLLYQVVVYVVDNALPRGNQPPNTKGNLGLALFFFSFWLWGVWSTVIGVFGLTLARRDRKGEQAGISNSLLMFLLSLWLWFAQVGPRVSSWLSALQSNEGWQWLPSLMNWLANGENARPVTVAALIVMVIWGWFEDNDNSSLIGAGCIWLGWSMLVGRPLGLELVIEDPTLTMKFGFGIAVVAVIVELYLAKAIEVGFLVGLISGVSWLASAGLSSMLAKLSAPGWLLEAIGPFWIGLAIIVWIGRWAHQQLTTKSKFFDGFYKLMGNWMGNFVPLGPIEVAVDANGLYILVYLMVYVVFNLKLF